MCVMYDNYEIEHLDLELVRQELMRLAESPTHSVPGPYVQRVVCRAAACHSDRAAVMSLADRIAARWSVPREVFAPPSPPVTAPGLVLG